MKNLKAELIEFFLWFRTNGELFSDKSIEQMISFYLKEKNQNED
jgi:hypothetical protein